MTFRVRVAFATALLSGGAIVACSSSAPPIPAAYVNAALQTSSTSPGVLCGFSSAQTVVAIGTETSPTPTSAVDGDIVPGGKASVACTVSAKGDGFDLDLHASVAGMGTMIVTGHVTSKGGETVTAAFQTTSGSFKSDACIFTYTYGMSPVSPTAGPAIAAGRVWGHVSCQAAVTTSGQMVVVPPSNMFALRQCDGEADLLFERCAM